MIKVSAIVKNDGRYLFFALYKIGEKV